MEMWEDAWVYDLNLSPSKFLKERAKAAKKGHTYNKFLKTCIKKKIVPKYFNTLDMVDPGRRFRV